jgi:hypothetical protein
MNTSTITDLAWEGAKLAFRLIMAARSRRDAEAIVHQLRALGETPRSDVAGIAAEAERRLRQDEPTQSTPVETRHTLVQHGPLERPRIAPDFPPLGPLGEGD